MNEVQKLLSELARELHKAQYKLEAPHWEQKRRWEVAGKLGYCKDLLHKAMMIQYPVKIVEKFPEQD